MTNEFEKVMSAFDGINLHEDIFSADNEGAEAYKDFEERAAKEADEYFDVVDPKIEDAKEIEDVNPEDYEGKIILSCPICHCQFFKAPEDIIVGEESEDGLVNVEEECPCCKGTGGFVKAFMVVPYVESTAEVTITDKEGNTETYDVDGEIEINTTKENDDLDEAVKRFAQKSINEDIEEVSVKDGSAKVEMNGTTIQVKTEKQETEELGVEEISDDEETTDNVADDEFDDLDVEEDNDEKDVDLNDVEVESLERAFLNAKPYYESFKVKDVATNGKNIFVEGVARTRSGRRIGEKFAITPRTIHNGRVTFVSEGLSRLPSIARGKVNNGVLVVESLCRKNRTRR